MQKNLVDLGIQFQYWLIQQCFAACKNGCHCCKTSVTSAHYFPGNGRHPRANCCGWAVTTPLYQCARLLLTVSCLGLDRRRNHLLDLLEIVYKRELSSRCQEWLGTFNCLCWYELSWTCNFHVMKGMSHLNVCYYFNWKSNLNRYLSLSYVNRVII